MAARPSAAAGLDRDPQRCAVERVHRVDVVAVGAGKPRVRQPLVAEARDPAAAPAFERVLVGYIHARRERRVVVVVGACDVEPL